MLQNPGERAGAAVVLRGKQGTGKGTLGSTLLRLFGVGRHALHITTPDHFASGRFNGHLADCIFLFADECHWPGNKAHAGRLKGMLAEATIMIERKGVDPIPVDNSLHVLISSNEE